MRNLQPIAILATVMTAGSAYAGGLSNTPSSIASSIIANFPPIVVQAPVVVQTPVAVTTQVPVAVGIAFGGSANVSTSASALTNSIGKNTIIFGGTKFH